VSFNPNIQNDVGIPAEKGLKVAMSIRRRRTEQSRAYSSVYGRVANDRCKVNPIISLGDGLVLSSACAGHVEVTYTGKKGDKKAKTAPK
jgi:hypothetical protein